ncbi:MAG: Rne/Rng family ribonuclease [Cyanobacteria bacterium TGS_CYA1]|nr:Rne/Rng family ribonuclease [Cyanobacteria bacterium TGS_CYA1]
MRKSLIISEQDSIAALLENDRVVELFVNRGELLLGDIYTCSVENILPGIDAAFVNLGKDKMGFLHANDIPGQGTLKERLVPKQKLLVQITKEPTGHKGPRVSTAISLPGRFLVLVPEERGVSISRRISDSRERARLKSVVNLIKPPGVGVIIRTEAKGQGDDELYEDFEQLWDTWQTIVSEAEGSIGPLLIYRDQDLLYRVMRDAYSQDVNEIVVDTDDGQKRAQDYLQGWANKNTRVVLHTDETPLLINKGVDKEIEAALSDRAELPSGGHLNIQPTEALTVIDVNSGRFTSSRTQAETVRRTNMEAAQEIPRQLRMRNIGGMVIVDFIDMESRRDQQQVLEMFERALEEDRAKPQIGQLSDLGLVELTRRRQGQSLRELFTAKCNHCHGQGAIPDLEIGHSEFRRVITVRTPEESGSRGLRDRNRNLKAVSALGGRIRPTMAAPAEVEVETEAENEVEHNNEDIPEEILAQMPEGFVGGEKSATANLIDEGDDNDDTDDSNENEEVQVHANHGDHEEHAHAKAVSEEEPVQLHLDKPVDLDAFNFVNDDEDEEVHSQPAHAHEHEHLNGDDEDESDHEVEETASSEEEIQSSHQAVETITGVFRLKRQEEEEEPQSHSHNPPIPRPNFILESRPNLEHDQMSGIGTMTEAQSESSEEE